MISHGSRVKVLLVAAIVILAGQASLFSQNSGLSGTVVDQVEHAPIRNVCVLVHRNEGTDVHVRTDPGGRYSVQVPSGLYDVFVSAGGFAPSCRKVEIKPDGMTNFDAALHASEVGMQQ